MKKYTAVVLCAVCALTAGGCTEKAAPVSAEAVSLTEDSLQDASSAIAQSENTDETLFPAELSLTELLAERERLQSEAAGSGDILLKDLAEMLTEKENDFTFFVEMPDGRERTEEGQTEGDRRLWIVDEELAESQAVMKELAAELESFLEEQDGTWSIYVKDLQTEVSFAIHNQEMYAASLIKLFVMEKCFADYEEIMGNQMEAYGSEGYGDGELSGEAYSEELVETLLAGMIEVSDNEYYNELIKLQNSELDFAQGAQELNEYLKEQRYDDTGLYHTLHPAASEYEWISEEGNHTSVMDCGALLEKIYDGECVSEEASAKMLELLLNQQVTWKIPAGLPEGVVSANKTGETDTDQHDAAIVFGPTRDYILCIMSADWAEGYGAGLVIQEISAMVYEYLE